MARILIVDDDAVGAQIYANKLQAENHQVEFVSDGLIALNKAKEKFDFILLDVMMPQIGGAEILKGFREGTNKNTPIVIFTNLQNGQIKRECLENGAKEFLLKADYSPSQLLEKIREYLE